jgi:alpha-tubulin suppressor-like RCC1 family protein
MRHINPFALGVSLFFLILSSACGMMPAAKASLIAAGGSQTCILHSDGVKCWGRNNAGQLGDGTTQDRNSPVAVTALPDKVTAIAVGYVHACAVTESAEVFCWGSQSAEQSRIGSDPGFIAVAVGSMHTCGLTAKGGVKCWGSNSFGGLGDGTTEERLTPVDVIGLSGDVISIAAGGIFSCAVQKGAAKCWGSNGNGQLGNGTYESSATPIGIPGLESGAAIVAAGVFHACAVKTNGEVWCWGENLAGELGDGTGQNTPIPVKVINLKGGIQTVALGGSHTCALTNAGGVKCWGANASGQLGDGTTTDRNSPVDVMGLSSGVIAIAAGGSHTCAVLNGGAVKCWGLNESGQLGNGSFLDSSVPVDVRMPPG